MDPADTSALETLQASALKLAQAVPFFAPVPMFYERQKNVSAEIAAALGRLKGIAILFLTPTGKNSNPGSPTVHLKVRLVAEVLENVMFNTGSTGTKLACSAVAEQCAAHLNHKLWKPGKSLVCEGMELQPHKTFLIYRVTFDTGVELVKL